MKTGSSENLLCLNTILTDLNQSEYDWMEEKSLENVQIVVKTSANEDNSPTLAWLLLLPSLLKMSPVMAAKPTTSTILIRLTDVG